MQSSVKRCHDLGASWTKLERTQWQRNRTDNWILLQQAQRPPFNYTCCSSRTREESSLQDSGKPFDISSQRYKMKFGSIELFQLSINLTTSFILVKSYKPLAKTLFLVSSKQLTKKEIHATYWFCSVSSQWLPVTFSWNRLPRNFLKFLVATFLLT